MPNIKHIVETATERILFNNGKNFTALWNLNTVLKKCNLIHIYTRRYIVTIDDYMNSRKWG